RSSIASRRSWSQARASLTPRSASRLASRRAISVRKRPGRASSGDHSNSPLRSACRCRRSLKGAWSLTTTRVSPGARRSKAPSTAWQWSGPSSSRASITRVAASVLIEISLYVPTMTAVRSPRYDGHHAGKEPGPARAEWSIGSRADSLSDGGVKLRALTARDRLQLLKFVCSFVWADLEVGSSEKTFVLSLTQRLGLSDAEIRQVQAWL